MRLFKKLTNVNSIGKVFEQNSAGLVFSSIEELHFWASGGSPRTHLVLVVPDKVRWTGNVVIENPVVAGGVDLAPITRLIGAIGDAPTGADTATGGGFRLTALVHVVPDEDSRTGTVIIDDPIVAGGVDLAPITRLVGAVGHALTGADTATGGGFHFTGLAHVVPDEASWTGTVIIHEPVVAGGVDLAAITRLVVAVGHALTGTDTAT